MQPRAAILGIAGTTLSAEEVAVFRATPPLGIILFARNIADPAQLVALNASIRDLLGEATPILVDQEGGRVARLRAPHWPDCPPAARFEDLPEAAARANAALHGLMCREAGFDVVCAPVLDLRLPGAHAVIGDRAFSDRPEEAARLGLAWAEGLQQAGCIPVIKHVPGHGRALVDSHLDLPRVLASSEELALDCTPFAALAGIAAWAMTAHIVYEAWDPVLPATLSPRVIEEVIRGAIGFDGILVSDDLCMQALRGEAGALARQSLAAGCDLVLHCNGDLAAGTALLRDCPPLTEAAAERLAETRDRVRDARQGLDPQALIAARDAQLTAAA